jgi:hypothetical protein
VGRSLHRQSGLVGGLPRVLLKSAANGRDRNAALPPIAVLISAVDHLEIQIISKVIRFGATFQKQM